eukprot:CAMPEP_0182457582 /NCGR_PEP_ID=MMETSP1319-20130603/3132_1 /TAXON_ID=172717 /ORGANISM="Bolidomonas pacifica, Strain RCC208" /LENGTH=246 /DNA_ID=CAMNT_0024656087 /DNA_START=78 /DNA_END=818 /DNA_ORIENTATION=-
MVLDMIPLNAMSADVGPSGKRVSTSGMGRSSKKARTGETPLNSDEVRHASPRYTGESLMTTAPDAKLVEETITIKVTEEQMNTAYWKKKFEELKKLQTTEAETNFDLLREQTADRISSMQKTIEFLEDKIGMRADEIASKDELLMVEKKLRAKEKTLGFYEKLTSTTVAYNKKSNKFECVCVNPENNKGVKFEVKRTKEGDNKFTAKGNAKFLPEFLRTSAVFDDTQFPFLLKEIYNTEMFKESEE